MKKFILSAIVILLFGFGKIIAQKFTVKPFIEPHTEVIANNKSNSPMPYLQEKWSKESLKAIIAISNKHGKPFQVSSRNLIWFVNGACNQTINFSEDFSLEIPENNLNEINYSNSNPIKYISLIPLETGICTNVIIKKSI